VFHKNRYAQCHAVSYILFEHENSVGNVTVDNETYVDVAF